MSRFPRRAKQPRDAPDDVRATKRRRKDTERPRAQYIRVRVATSDQLVAIFDDLHNELQEPGIGSFYHNRNWLAEAYKEERLFVIEDGQLDDDSKRALFEAHGASYAPTDRVSNWGRINVPAFAVTDKDAPSTLGMLWVRKDWRHFGYARAAVNALGIQRLLAIPGARDFWKRIGFQETRDWEYTNVWMQRIEDD